MEVIELIKERYLFVLLYLAAFAVSSFILWGGWRLRLHGPRSIALVIFLSGLLLAVATLYLLVYVLMGDVIV